MKQDFREYIQEEYIRRIEQKKQGFNDDELIKIDLHCHDYNSDKPDELWGRILRLPETWLSSEDLFSCLASNKTDLPTVTNHNNARSCWEMMDKGHDVLSGAEFTCYFKEYNIYAHVLVYGFDPRQEEKLKKYRKDVYRFLRYAAEEDLPVVLPHPLFLYSKNNHYPMEFYEKLLLLFERFEVLNGQRNIWQNLLTLDWLEGINEEEILRLSQMHGINPNDFCKNPAKKRFTGGSDDHMGIFAGTCGSYLHVPNLTERRKKQKLSELALETLRNGEIIPYGVLGEEDEKLTIAFLDYFCQVAMNMKDPGMLRLFLHKGTTKEKLMCLGIANGMMELRRHKHSMVFLKTFHESLHGIKPNYLRGLMVSKDYKPFFNQVKKIAKAKRTDNHEFLSTLRESILLIFNGLNNVAANRLTKSMAKHSLTEGFQGEDIHQLLLDLDCPSNLRTLFGDNAELKKSSYTDILDKLSFPTLISTVIASATFASSIVLNQSRHLFNQFAERSGKYEHPKRVLWLTDTLFDHNGVSSVLQSVLAYVRKHDLPIDFLACGEEARSESHLHVVASISEFQLEKISPQQFRVPDLLEIQRIFSQGGYDRIVCSTEFFMGAIGLFLKHAYCVPVHLYMHTDWLDFFKRNVPMPKKDLNRVRRMIRAYYKNFDGIFVLNSDHQKWLTGNSMGLKKENVHKTAHWVDDCFQAKASGVKRKRSILFAGRLSEEKGVMDVVKIYEQLQMHHDDIELWFVGEGPAKARLEKEVKNARFYGWLDKRQLAEVYSTAGILVLPSHFDTFGCVVLEALSCGLPVAAYDTKGPKDIIVHKKSGYLGRNPKELSRYIKEYFENHAMRKKMSKSAVIRSQDYRASVIMEDFMMSLDLPVSPNESNQRVT